MLLFFLVYTDVKRNLVFAEHCHIWCMLYWYLCQQHIYFLYLYILVFVLLVFAISNILDST